MVGYVVEVDAARVGYGERVSDEFVVVVAVEGAGVGVVEPLEFLGDSQGGGRHPSAGGVGVAYGVEGFFVGLGSVATSYSGTVSARRAANMVLRSSCGGMNTNLGIWVSCRLSEL